MLTMIFFLNMSTLILSRSPSLSPPQDYLGCIIDCGDLPLKADEVSTLFCNIEDIYEFNRLDSSAHIQTYTQLSAGRIHRQAKRTPRRPESPRMGWPSPDGPSHCVCVCRYSSVLCVCERA